MRKFKIAAAVGLMLASVTSFAASDTLSAEMSVNVDSGHVFRGMDLSPNDPTMGGALGLTHSSGFGVKLATQTADMNGESFMRNQLGVSYSFEAAPGVQGKVGVDRHLFTGIDGLASANFTEVVGSIHHVSGLTGKLAYAVSGGDAWAKNNLYTEVGYTHTFGSAKQYHIGGDIGYTFYSDDAAALGAEDSISSAQIRGGVQINKNLDVSVSYQLDLAEDGFGHDASGNDKIGVRLNYKF